MWAQLQAMKGMLMRVSAFFFILTILALTTSVRWYKFLFIVFPWPSTSGGTVPDYFINSIRVNLIPNGASLFISNPLDAFTLYVGIAATFASTLTIVYALFELWRFIKPALYPHERKGLFLVLFSSVILLVAGALFGYRVLVPTIFKALYPYVPVGVAPLFNLSDVVQQVTGMIFIGAVSFLLPVLIVLLSISGLVPVRFWRTYARHALFIVIVATAVLTPDGSGVSMVLLTVPLCILYAAGYIVSAYVLHWRRKRAAKVR